jgi:hypothetical protein
MADTKKAETKNADPNFEERYFGYALRIGALLFLVLFGILLVSDKGNAFQALIAAAICLLGTRFDQVAGFKLGLTGIEAKLNEAVRRAEVTIEQFHSLAQTWADIALQQQYAGGRIGIDRAAQRRRRDQIVDALHEMGLSQDQTDRLHSAEREWTLWDHVQYVLTATKPTDAAAYNEALIAFYKIHKGPQNRPSAEQLATLLASGGWINAEVGERLADFRHYEQTKQHRRPQVWERPEWE